MFPAADLLKSVRLVKPDCGKRSGDVDAGCASAPRCGFSDPEQR
jgi:hypothetical protein